MAVTAIANRKYNKQTPTKLPVGVKIHNRFDFYINDKPVAYGESEYQAGMAENIVLDQMYTRLCARSSYFVNIHFGTGTGTLSASRTSLFTHLGTKTAVNDAQSKALPTSWWRQKIVLNPEEYVGSALSEVGIAFGSTSTNLVTHALIRDMNGNPITLTKTALDVVTIYATVYVTFSTSNANLQLCGMPNNNSLVNYLVGGTAWPTCYFYAGENASAPDEGDYAVLSYALGTSSALSWTTDTANKKTHSNTYRFGVDYANGAIKEIGLGGGNQANPFFRLVLPAAGLYAGLDIEGVPVGTGDGVLDAFALPSKDVDPTSLVVYVDGVETATTLETAISANNRLYAPLITTQAGGGNKLSFAVSDDKTIIAFGYVQSSSYVNFKVFERVDGATWVERAISGASNTYGYSVALSADGSILVVGTNSWSPYVQVFIRNGNVWVRATDPDTTPGSSTGVVRLSSDGLVLAISSIASPYIYTYDLAAGQYIKRANPANLPAGGAVWCALSSDGTVLAVAHANSPYLTVYDWVTDTWVKRTATFSDFPGAATPNSVCLSGDGQVLCVTSNTSPYFAVYDWVTDTWVKRADPSTLPAYGVDGCSLDVTGDSVILSHSESPYLVAYDWDGEVFWLANNQSNLQAYYAYPHGASRDHELVGYNCGNSNAVFLSLHDYEKRGHRIRFATPPANGAVITADYTVKGIHKTAQRVIDLYAEITFGEVT